VQATMPADDLELLRRKLAEIGRRRKAQNTAIEKLAHDTVEAVNLAQGKLGATEIAALVGLERTTLYRVYRRGR
jgi:transcriptional regulator of acetoin/glycerol metabolism